jgi:pimeloyl-ACP methyl ester carboxylesterase
MRKGYVDTDFGQIHYYADGEAGPRLFLFHEGGLSAQFEKTLPYLARHCRAVAFDTPGNGMSDAPSAPLTMAEYAARFVAAIDFFGDEPCVLAGAHTGASFVLNLAANSLSARTTHVVLTGIALLTDEEIAAFRSVIGKLPTIQRDGSHLLKRWQGNVQRFTRAGNTDLDMLHWAMVQGLLAHDRALSSFDAVFAQDVVGELKKLACPVYFLVGEHDSLVESDKKAAALVPGSKLYVLSGIGGRLPNGEPELYAKEVLGFIGALS